MKLNSKLKVIKVIVAVLLCAALLSGCLPGVLSPSESNKPDDGTATEAPATKAPEGLVDVSLDDALSLWGKVRTSAKDTDRYAFLQKTPGGKLVATGMSWSSGKAFEQLIIKEVKKEKDAGVYYVNADRFTDSGKVSESFTVSAAEGDGLTVDYKGESTLFTPDDEIEHMRMGNDGFGPESYSGITGAWGEVRSLYLNGDIFIAIKEDADGRLVATKGKWSDSSAAVDAYIIGAAMSISEDYIVTVDRVYDGKTVRESFVVNSLFAATVFGTEYEPIRGAYIEDSYADHPDMSKLQKLTNEEIKNAWGYLRSAGGDEWSDYYITLVESDENELWADLSTWSEGKIYSQVKIVGVWKDNWTENHGKFFVVVDKNINGENARFYITGDAIDFDTIMTLYFKGAVTMGSPTIDLPTTSFIMDSTDNHAKFGSGEFQPFYRKWSELITQWGNVRTNENNSNEYIVLGNYFGGLLLARKYSWDTGEVLSQAYVVGARADWRFKSYVVTLDLRTDAGYERVYLTIMSGSNELHDDLYAWTYNGVNAIYYLDSFSNHS